MIACSFDSHRSEFQVQIVLHQNPRDCWHSYKSILCDEILEETVTNSDDTTTTPSSAINIYATLNGMYGWE